jgi:hypothetical protein
MKNLIFGFVRGFIGGIVIMGAAVFILMAWGWLFG